MAHLVGALEIDGHQVRRIAVVEIAGDALVHARRRDDARQRDDRIFHAGARGQGLRDLGLGHRHESGELRRSDLSVAGDDLRDTGREIFRIGHAGEGQILEEDRARVVGHEESFDLFGRMRGPPADHAHAQPRRRREIPHGRHRARESRDRHLLPRLPVDLLEIEDPVHVGPHTGRGRGPQQRREDRKEAREPAGRALRDEARPVGHLAFRRKPVEQLPVEAVQAEPDHGCPGSRRAAGFGAGPPPRRPLGTRRPGAPPPAPPPCGIRARDREAAAAERRASRGSKGAPHDPGAAVLSARSIFRDWSTKA